MTRERRPSPLRPSIIAASITSSSTSTNAPTPIVVRFIAATFTLKTGRMARNWSIRPVSAIDCCSARRLGSLSLGTTGGRPRGPVAQWFHPPATDDCPNGLLDGMKRRIDGRLNGGVSSSDNDARQAAQDYLDGADLVDPAARPIQIGYADADPLNGCRELPELCEELVADVVVVVLGEFHANRSHVGRNGNFCAGAGSSISIRKRRPQEVRNSFTLLLVMVSSAAANMPPVTARPELRDSSSGVAAGGPGRSRAHAASIVMNR